MKQFHSSEDADAVAGEALSPLSADEKTEFTAFIAKNVPREATGELLNLLRPLRAAKPDNPSRAKIEIMYEAIYGELCRRAAADPKAFHEELCIADIWDVFEPTLWTVARSMPSPLTDAEVAKANRATRFTYALMTRAFSVCEAEESSIHHRCETLIRRRCGIGAPGTG